MEKYKVSIVIPAYNASNYLAEAIESALNQTYENIEIIVVNDGSQDEGATRKIALSYGDKIRYFEKENGGSSSALNTGICNMEGEWFSWLSHDDLYEPNKIQEQMNYLKSLEISAEEISKHIVFSSSQLIDAKGKIIKKFNYEKEKQKADRIEKIKGNEVLVSEPTVNNYHGCSCLVHKNVFKKVGLFDEHLRLINDMDLWYRIYISGYKIHYIPKPLVYGRVHSKQVSRSIGFSYHNSEQDMFWERSLNWLFVYHPKEEQLFLNFGRNAFLKTRYEEGKLAYEHLKKLNPKLKNKLDTLSKIYIFKAKTRDYMKKVYLKIK